MQINQRDYDQVKTNLNTYKKFERQKSNPICLFKLCLIVIPIALIFKPEIWTALVLAAILVFSGVIEHKDEDN
jgi:hypothetical protein